MTSTDAQTVGAAETRRMGAVRNRRGPRLSFGLAPLLALTAAAGLVLVALGDNAARISSGEAQPLFWGGLVVIYMPIALRLLSVSASREERMALALLLGGALFLVKVIYSPTGFTLHDELATWRQTSDLLATGHPLTSNPLVTGYAGFPGLELFTAAVSQLTGLRIFIVGLAVIGTARVVLMLALFVFLERAAGSARAAGIGIAIYACNPSFLYFDSQFGYESLAIVIGGRASARGIAVDPNGPHRARLERRGTGRRDGDPGRHPGDHPPHDLVCDDRVPRHLGCDDRRQRPRRESDPAARAALIDGPLSADDVPRRSPPARGSCSRRAR